jgi:hypothetical protein
MKRTILFILIAGIMFLAVGCGHGQPFEIEPTNSAQPGSTLQLASAN